MTRGTAVSAPFALAHLLFLPGDQMSYRGLWNSLHHAKVPFKGFKLIMVITVTVSHKIITHGKVTYSMIFHRGIPNFSYASGAEDNNAITLDIVDSSTITIDAASEMNVIVNISTEQNVEVVGDNYVVVSEIASSSAMITAQDIHISEDGSIVNAEVVAGHHGTMWTVGSSSKSEKEDLTNSRAPESNETPLPDPSDILALLSSTMATNDGEDNNIQMSTYTIHAEDVEHSSYSGTPDSNETSSLPTPLEVLILRSTTLTMNAEKDDNASMIRVSEILTIDSDSFDKIVVNASTANTVDFGADKVSASWFTERSTDVIEVSGNSVSPQWIADSSALEDIVAEVSDSNVFTNNESTEVFEDWNETCATGKMQSPIHITTVTAEYNPEAQPLVFVNYDLASLEAALTPHTIKFDLKPQYVGPQIGIAGGGLIGFYSLNHIHLHWSSSEHSIDHKSYKMEAHLVHFKAPYSNLTQEEVLDEPDGIAVLAVLFELGTADPSIEDLIANLGRNLTEAELPKVMPQSFLPENTDEYIRYRGSLTTPPCSEVVIWTVFPTPKTLTQYQVNWLATRKLSEGVPDPDNYRPTQKRNDREIVFMKASYTYNIVPGRVPDSSASYGAPSIVLLLTAILCLSIRSS